jgi:hypothetical protein
MADPEEEEDDDHEEGPRRGGKKRTLVDSDEEDEEHPRRRRLRRAQVQEEGEGEGEEERMEEQEESEPEVVVVEPSNEKKDEEVFWGDPRDNIRIKRSERFRTQQSRVHSSFKRKTADWQQLAKLGRYARPAKAKSAVSCRP